MNSAQIQMVCDTIDEGGAVMLFTLQLLGFGAVLVIVCLFASLSLHRWLKRSTWSSVITNTEKKALR